MSKRTCRRLAATGSIATTLLIGSAGCFGLNRGAPPQQHYVLGAASSPAGGAPAAATAGPTLGLRRIQIAAYLDTPFIVVRRGGNKIGFSDLHRWGENLNGGIPRAVAGYLSRRGSFGAVAVAPWAPRERYDYLIQLNVLRFEGLAPDDGAPEAPETPVGGEAHLLVTWEVLRQGDEVVLARGTTDHQVVGWTVGDYPALVTLLDEGLAVLTEELAAAIAELPPLEP